jgi:hypothetical protein
MCLVLTNSKWPHSLSSIIITVPQKHQVSFYYFLNIQLNVLILYIAKNAWNHLHKHNIKIIIWTNNVSGLTNSKWPHSLS